MFSLSGKVNIQIPCFPCAVATLSTLTLCFVRWTPHPARRIKNVNVPNYLFISEIIFRPTFHVHMREILACPVLLINFLSLQPFPALSSVLKIKIYHLQQGRESDHAMCCKNFLCCMQDKTSLIKVKGRQQNIFTFLT